MNRFPVLFDWMRRIRLPALLLIPGDLLAAFLLCSVYVPGEKFLVFSVCCSVICVNVYAALLRKEQVRSSVSAEAIKALFWTVSFAGFVFASVTIGSFLCYCVLFTLVTLRHFRYPTPLFNGLCTLFRTILGISIIPLFGITARLFPFALGYALAMMLCTIGISRAMRGEMKKIQKHKGSYFVLAGGILGYIALFIRIGFQPVSKWYTYLPGLLSAFTAAIFVITVWKGFRILRKPALPGVVREACKILSGCFIFAQAAAVSATGHWFLALLLLAAGVIAKLITSQLNKGEL